MLSLSLFLSLTVYIRATGRRPGRSRLQATHRAHTHTRIRTHSWREVNDIFRRLRKGAESRTAGTARRDARRLFSSFGRLCAKKKEKEEEEEEEERERDRDD